MTIKYNENQLAAAICLQAARDYLLTNYTRTKKSVIKDLSSDWMNFISSGLSVTLAEQLKYHPETVRENMKLGEIQ